MYSSCNVQAEPPSGCIFAHRGRLRLPSRRLILAELDVGRRSVLPEEKEGGMRHCSGRLATHIPRLTANQAQAVKRLQQLREEKECANTAKIHALSPSAMNVISSCLFGPLELVARRRIGLLRPRPSQCLPSPVYQRFSIDNTILI